MTIFAVGTVLLWLEFDCGIPVEYLNGFSHCFEFAVYTADISEKLRGVAQRRVEEAIIDKGTALVEISKRPEPRVETDADGYKELRLFTSFTGLVLCIDDIDEQLLPNILKTLQFNYFNTKRIYFLLFNQLTFP